MSRRKDPQGRLVPLCEIEGCVVAAIGLGRCVQHVAPLISVSAIENVPAVEWPGRSVATSDRVSESGRYG